MKVKIKKLHPDAIIPSYARSGDAGMDLVAISVSSPGSLLTYGTGLSVEIPEGFVGLIFPRSSIYKTGFILSNSIGVIDSGYRGEIMIKFYDQFKSVIKYNIGDKIAQLIIMPHPQIELEEVEELETSERGAGGFGSTGK